MAKNRKRTVEEVREALKLAEHDDPEAHGIISTHVKVPVREKIEIRHFMFPRYSTCPRCGSENTTSYCTKGRKQYRKCMKPICRNRYTSIGVEVVKRSNQDLL